ncbi:MAG: hypothetical protein ACK521_09745 [bacterium]
MNSLIYTPEPESPSDGKNTKLNKLSPGGRYNKVREGQNLM